MTAKADLVEWLEARLMGAHAPKFAAAGFESLDRLKFLRSEAERERLLALFSSNPGHRLKLRIGLDELQSRAKPQTAAAALARTPSASASASAAAAGAKKPLPIAPALVKLASKPSAAAPGDDDEDDEDEKDRARMSLQASADADSDDDAANKKRRDKAAASKLFASAPLAGAGSPKPGFGRIVSVVPGPPPPEDDDDDDAAPPPPAKSPTSPALSGKPGLDRIGSSVPGPPPPDADGEDDALDPTYSAPYVPQNLPEMPDSDHEGPSEEDEVLTDNATSGSSTPRGVVGLKKPIPPAPPRKAAPAAGTPALPPANGTSAANGKAKPPRSATSPNTASLNTKPVPLPPPKKKPDAAAKTDADLDLAATTPGHRPSNSDGAAAAAGSSSTAGGGSALASGQSTTMSATPRDSTSSAQSGNPHSPPQHVTVTGAPESAAASPGTSPSGSLERGGTSPLNKFGTSLSPTHSPTPSVMTAAADANSNGSGLNSGRSMRESVLMANEMLPPRSKLSVPERIQQLRLAQRAAKAAGSASPLARETSGGGGSNSGTLTAPLNLGAPATRHATGSVVSSSSNAGSAAAAAAGAGLIIANALAGAAGAGGSSPQTPATEQFPAAALAGCQEDETTDLAAGALPTVDSLGSSEQLFKAGRLEKLGAPKGLFNQRSWSPHIVVLSRDGHFYWIKGDDEKTVTGYVKILRPSVRFELNANDSSILEIVDGRPATAAGTAGAAAAGAGPVTYQFRLVEGRSAGQSSKHPRLGTLTDDEAEGWLHAFKLQRVAAYNKRHGSGKGTDKKTEAVLTAVNESERKRREAAELLRRGAVFKKFKRGAHSKERMIWCSDTCDRIFWGDKTKKTVKGYIMLHELTAVTPGVCPGSKKPAQAMSVVSKARTLELEADSSEDKDRWCAALKLLTGLK